MPQFTCVVKAKGSVSPTTRAVYARDEWAARLDLQKRGFVVLQVTQVQRAVTGATTPSSPKPAATASTPRFRRGTWKCSRCGGGQVFPSNAQRNVRGCYVASEIGDTGLTMAAPVGGGPQWVKVLKCQACKEVLSLSDYTRSDDEDAVLGNRNWASVVVASIAAVGVIFGLLQLDWFAVTDTLGVPLSVAFAGFAVLVVWFIVFASWLYGISLAYGSIPEELGECEIPD